MSKQFVPTRNEVLANDLPVEMATLIARRLYQLHHQDEQHPEFSVHHNSSKCELYMTWRVSGSGALMSVVKSEQYKTKIEREMVKLVAKLHEFFL